MTTGKVKWFNNAKGYGFVLAECADEDLFVHYSSIQMTGYRTLRAGQDVAFDIEQGPKGLHAVNVRPTDAQDEMPSPDEMQAPVDGANTEDGAAAS
ncbi:MAG: cold shock domain-containing protein [Pseudomonadales bacterium]|nr:cold shock domain-containing protein [Pseudomonadales bacterium]